MIEIDRIASACSRYEDAFLRRVLSSEELKNTTGMTEGRLYEFVAGRFAVKEAMAKASGVGLARLHMSSVSVMTGVQGLSVQFHNQDHPWSNGDWSWHLSISHSNSIAFAVAILEHV